MYMTLCSRDIMQRVKDDICGLVLYDGKYVQLIEKDKVTSHLLGSRKDCLDSKWPLAEG